MAHAITVPRLGWNMDEGVFAGWLKQDGEAVQVGDPLFSLEGEKATQDIEAIDPGTLRLGPETPAPGDRVAVGAVIGHLLEAGETAEGLPLPTAPQAARATSREPVAAPSLQAPRPRVDRRRISPLARRIARELGVDWSHLEGSGRTGRIRKVDILEASRSAPRLVETARGGRSIAVGPVRRAIAGKMLESLRSTAPVTLSTTLDATNLVNLRAQYKAARVPDRPVPGHTDILVKLVALALGEHPLLNARWDGDRIVLSDEAHIGIAVDTESGLLVPVIRGASTLGLTAITERARDLIARARAQILKAAEMQGGTFTITNLGAFGVETFTPIINPPECAILGVGRIARLPVVAGDQIVPGDRLALSLTFDHRIVDGAPAARFLARIAALVENPGPWLIS